MSDNLKDRVYYFESSLRQIVIKAEQLMIELKMNPDLKEISNISAELDLLERQMADIFQQVVDIDSQI